MKLKLVVLCAFAGTFSTGITSSYAQIRAESKPLILAQATPIFKQDQPLKFLIKDADFIFQGVVTKVEYRLSQQTTQAPALPYTFVTFKIAKLLKGKAQQDSVTLRFAGGDFGDGRILKVSHCPLFDVGDQDVLFVKRNGQSECPLVGWDEGRFRVIKDQVFSDSGRPLSLNNEGQLAFGERQLLPEVMSNRIGTHVLRKRVDHKQDVEAEGTREYKPVFTALNFNQVEGLIQTQIGKLAQTGELKTTPIVSANIQQAFVAPLLEPVALPRQAKPTMPQEVTPMNEVERQELEIIKQQEEAISRPSR